MLNIACSYASRERYDIHPVKSEVAVFNSDIHPSDWQDAEIWEINEAPARVVPQYSHLGVVRSTANRGQISLNFKKKLTTGRRTLYSLMGAGLHGMNGLTPPVSLHVYATYVIPRMLSGLESSMITTAEMTELEKFHRATLRCFQHLPERTAKAAIYLLIGSLPIEAILDVRYLSLFGSIVRCHSSKVHEVMKRQIIMKDLKDADWFSYVRRLLIKYNLPSAHDVTLVSPTKLDWKKRVKSAVGTFWSDRLMQDADEKSSLRYISFPTIGTPHNIWKACGHDKRSVRRATIKAKLMTGTYRLQANQSLWRPGKPSDALCTVCKRAPEDRLHFVVLCEALHHIRLDFWVKLDLHLRQYSLIDLPVFSDLSPDVKLQLILDCTHPSVTWLVADDPELHLQIEDLATRMCFQLHLRRATLLDYNP